MRNILPLVSVALVCLLGCSGNNNGSNDFSAPASVTAITPLEVVAGAASLQMHLTGSHFHAFTSVVVQNTPTAANLVGQNLDQLDVTLPSSLLSVGGTYPISVWTVGDPTKTEPTGAVLRASTSFSLQVDNPVPTISTISPSSIGAQAEQRSITVTGVNFTSTSSVVVNGAARQTTFVSSTQLSAVLAAGDIQNPSTLSVLVSNPPPAGGPSNTLPLLVTQPSITNTKYSAYGDSITAGYTLPDVHLAYPYLLSGKLNVPVSDYAVVGDYSCDVFSRIYAGGAAAVSPGTLFSLMIGTNDSNADRPVRTTYNECQRAVIAWLATRNQDKVLPGDPRISVTGSCQNTANPLYLGGIYCPANLAGTIRLPNLVSTGNSLYIWYGIQTKDDLPTFTVSVDGKVIGTYDVNRGANLIYVRSATIFTASLLQIPVTAGTHDVQISTDGDLAVLGFGTNTGALGLIPTLAVGDIPHERTTDGIPTAANAAIATGYIKANVGALKADGLDVRYVETRDYMMGTPAEMDDFEHPNALGHEELFNAFYPVISASPF